LNVLVTGGGGFLGKALCRKLVERGDRVRSLSRADYPELREMGVETFRADLSDPKLLEAVRGCDAVYHAAAKAGLWGPHAEFFRANVSGTASVIDACLVEGVPKLIYTSSPSVVFGASGQEGVDESLGYPESFLASYPETKAEAEQLALAANSERLAVVALRPHLIWGPGDNHILPRLVAVVAPEGCGGSVGEIRLWIPSSSTTRPTRICSPATACRRSGERSTSSPTESRCRCGI